MADQKKLEGKIAIVTGAGSSGPGFGTGKAISVLFARAGAKVALVDMSDERAQDTKKLIEQEGGEAFVIVADLSSIPECQRVVDETVQRFGRLDILVNNAAVPPTASLLETTPDYFAASVAVNLAAPFFLTKAAIPVMAKNGGGSIILFSSSAAMRAQGGEGGAIYAATKGAMHAFMRDVAGAYGKQGIRVNCIAPGFVDTPMYRGTLKNAGADEEMLNQMLVARTSLGIPGDAWDVAEAALYLSSPEAKYITSVLIPVDGGVTQRCG